MHRFLCLAGFLLLCASLRASGEEYYAASLVAVPTGAVTTQAFSFRFRSSTVLAPSLGSPIYISSQPGFASSGTAKPGFILKSIYYLLATSGDNTFFQATFVDSAGDSLVLNIIPVPLSFLSSNGTYAVENFTNLIVPGTPYTIVGATGTGSVSVTSFLVPIGDQYCPAGAYGSGGIYNQSQAYCQLGAVVPNGYTFCPNANGIQGHIYDGLLASCENGSVIPLVPPPGTVGCPPGREGLGGFYDPGSSVCGAGVIVPIGEQYCPAGVYGPGGIYDGSQGEGCDRGVVLPPGQAYCRPGIKGGGGLYIIAMESCDQGSIGPR